MQPTGPPSRLSTSTTQAEVHRQHTDITAEYLQRPLSAIRASIATERTQIPYNRRDYSGHTVEYTTQVRYPQRRRVHLDSDSESTQLPHQRKRLKAELHNELHQELRNDLNVPPAPPGRPIDERREGGPTRRCLACGSWDHNLRQHFEQGHTTTKKCTKCDHLFHPKIGGNGGRCSVAGCDCMDDGPPPRRVTLQNAAPAPAAGAAEQG